MQVDGHIMVNRKNDSSKLEKVEKGDAVAHPSHYTAGDVEVIDYIEQVTKAYDDAFVGYCVGNVIKYVSRAPYKHESPLEDLKKARQYLEFAIKYLEGGGDDEGS